ncbi:MAG: MATE family efflux transporter [Acholeplasmatales bacterium]|jgi:putative MATE family efflux protein|nr:MATE family efflux transporter [Acholeplasmatales bacterium]
MDILKSEKLKNTPVNKLLIAMSLPAIFSMFVQALYNIVDTIFVSWKNDSYLDAVSIAFPLQMLVIAFAVGIGVGANSLVARSLGESKVDKANKTLNNSIFLSLVSGIIFILIGIFIPRVFMQLFTSNENIIDYGVSYLSICLIGSTFVLLEISLSRCLQATGNMKMPMIGQLVGAITNIILDPIFIFLFNLGISGAAIATVIGQFAALLVSIFSYTRLKQDLMIIPKYFLRPDYEIIKEICIIGLPAMIMNSISSFTIIILNIFVKDINYAIKVLGIYFKLQSFVFMPIFGLMQGSLPILAYNYGNNNPIRFKKTFNLTLVYSFGIGLLGFLIFMIFPKFLMDFFNSNSDLKEYGAFALRLISINFIFASLSIPLTNVFQSLGSGIKSLAMSLLRQLVLLLPIAYLFTLLADKNYFWLAYPISEFIVFCIFLPLALQTIKKKVNFVQEISFL